MFVMTISARSNAVLLAHAGGWDEIVLIGVPIAFMAGLLLLAKRRVEASRSDAHRSSADSVSKTDLHRTSD